MSVLTRCYVKGHAREARANSRLGYAASGKSLSCDTWARARATSRRKRPPP